MISEKLLRSLPGSWSTVWVGGGGCSCISVDVVVQCPCFLSFVTTILINQGPQYTPQEGWAPEKGSARVRGQPETGLMTHNPWPPETEDALHPTKGAKRG